MYCILNNRYAAIKYNDIVDGEGVCVSFWVQGCPYHCNGCHNPHTWDFEGGLELPDNIDDIIIKSINKNGVLRNFSILGGEPLCDQNIELVMHLISKVRSIYSNSIKIFLWTGRIIECNNKDLYDDNIKFILDNIDIIIDGPFILEQRDIRLKLRGSSNQRIWRKDLNNNWFIEE